MNSTGATGAPLSFMIWAYRNTATPKRVLKPWTKIIRRPSTPACFSNHSSIWSKFRRWTESTANSLVGSGVEVRGHCTCPGVRALAGGKDTATSSIK